MAPPVPVPCALSPEKQSARIAPGRRGLLLRCRFGWELCVLPTVPSAEEGCRVLDSVSIHVQHRTGARMLGVSSTVRDVVLAERQVLPSRRKLLKRDVDRAGGVGGLV